MLATNDLLNYIREKGLKQGDKLPPQSQLCQELKIGIRSFREDLNILKQHGIIETKKKGGTFIGSVSVKSLIIPINWQLNNTGYSLEQMIMARAILESSVTAQAAKFRTTKDLLHMLEAIEDIEKFTKTSKEHAIADGKFHLAILKSCHNPVLEIFGQLIVEQFKQKTKEDFYLNIASVEYINQSHRQIYDCVEKRDSEKAQKLMYQHIISQLKEKNNFEK